MVLLFPLSVWALWEWGIELKTIYIYNELELEININTHTSSEFYGPSDEAENLRVLNHALDIGCTFIDTADMYGSGENEKLIAKILKTRRSEVFLCTKVADYIILIKLWNNDINGILYIKHSLGASVVPMVNS